MNSQNTEFVGVFLDAKRKTELFKLAQQRDQTLSDLIREFLPDENQARAWQTVRKHQSNINASGVALGNR